MLISTSVMAGIAGCGSSTSENGPKTSGQSNPNDTPPESTTTPTEPSTTAPTEPSTSTPSCESRDIDEFPVGEPVTITATVESKSGDGMEMDFDYGVVVMENPNSSQFDEVRTGDCVTISGEWAQDQMSGDYYVDNAAVTDIAAG